MKLEYNAFHREFDLTLDADDVQGINQGALKFHISNPRGDIVKSVFEHNEKLIEENKKLKGFIKAHSILMEELKLQVTAGCEIIKSGISKTDDVGLVIDAIELLNKCKINKEKWI